MVMRNYFLGTDKTNGTGHITFVYGKTVDGDIAGLGGNQSDRLKLSPYKVKGVSAKFQLKGKWLEQKFHGFYIPVTYEEYAKSQPEPEIVDIDDANKNFLNIAYAASSTNESTR
jgi:hypothetical protein